MTPAKYQPRNGKRQFTTGNNSIQRQNRSVATIQNTGTSETLDGQQSSSVKLQPDAPVIAQVTFSIVAAAGHNGTDEIPFVPQLASNTFPANVTLTNSNFSQANFLIYFAEMSCLWGRIVVTTDNNLNWGKQIKFLKWDPSGTQVSKTITWDGNYKNFNYLDQTGRVIENSGYITGNMYMKYTLVGLTPSSQLNFTVDIVGMNLPRDYVPVPSI